MAHTRVGAYGVCVAGERILLSRYTSGNWALPGGGVDFGEDPYDGVIREVREETGYVVEPEALLGVRSVVWKGGAPDGTDTHMVSLLYSVRVVSGELTPEVDGSSDLAAWIELADLPALPRVQAVDAGLDLLRRIPPS
jgi:ADP-ribose pyrophosphatase YjhB (NUDIX family)